MPINKTTKKTEKKSSTEEKIEQGIEKFLSGVEELKVLSKNLKMRYDKADDKTKKKVVGAIAASAAILVSIAGIKHFGRKEKKD